MKISNKLLVMVGVFVFSLSFVFAGNVEELGFFERASLKFYCTFSNCDLGTVLKNDNQEKKVEKKVEKKIKQKEEIKKDNSSEDKQVVNVVKKQNQPAKIIDQTKYIDRTKTIKQIIEKTPTVNKYYPKEIINKTETIKVTEEYDDSSLLKKIKNNRSLIDQIAGLTDSDDLSNNSINDLTDVNTTGVVANQILSWNGSVWAPVNPGGGGGGINNVVEDLTPQLGGDLDVNGQEVVSLVNGDIGFRPNGTGSVVVNQGAPDGRALEIVSTLGGARTHGLVYIDVQNPTYDGPILRIVSNSTDSEGTIRLDSPTPEIEMVETDQVGPAGKWEMRVQDDKWQINSRNAADNSFEKLLTTTPARSGGALAINMVDNAISAHLQIAHDDHASALDYVHINSTRNSTDGDIASINNDAVFSIGAQSGAWTTSDGSLGHIQHNSNQVSPNTIDLENTISVGTGTGGANATNKYLGQFGWVSRDSSFTAPKLVAYIGAEATETYGADTDTGSAIVFYTGTDNNTNPDEKMRIEEDGNIGIGTNNPTSKLQVVGLPEYADNAAAIVGGLTVGAFYRTGDILKVVH